MPTVDRRPAQDDCQHGFADTGRPDEQNIGRVGEVGACCEFSDEFLVDAGLGGEVEVFELPGGGEVREPHPGVPATLLGGFDLDPEQPLEELGMTDAGSVGLVKVGWQGLGCGCQLEVGKMAAELLVERVWAHRRLRFCWSMCRW